jgi:exopolyphosphatase/guanosine-5'-triphosphate,3'-diphosphate pyrophosphatase
VVVDLGGGSTEFMAKGGGKSPGESPGESPGKSPEKSPGISIDMGSVRFTERFLKSDPVTDAEFWSCQEKIDELLTELEEWRGALRDPELVAVAGTATTLAAWHLGLEKFDPQAINQVELTRGDLHRMVEELKWRKASERAKLPGMEAGRADVILAGAMILWRTLERLDFQSCRVSTRGLRYGVLLAGYRRTTDAEKFGRK